MHSWKFGMAKESDRPFSEPWLHSCFQVASRTQTTSFAGDSVADLHGERQIHEVKAHNLWPPFVRSFLTLDKECQRLFKHRQHGIHGHLQFERVASLQLTRPKSFAPTYTAVFLSFDPNPVNAYATADDGRDDDNGCDRACPTTKFSVGTVHDDGDSASKNTALLSFLNVPHAPTAL